MLSGAVHVVLPEEPGAVQQPEAGRRGDNAITSPNDESPNPSHEQLLRKVTRIHGEKECVKRGNERPDDA